MPLSLCLVAMLFLNAGCRNDNNIAEKNPFEAEMLGLVPGPTTAELNLTWYSDTNAKPSVRIFDENDKLLKTWQGNSGESSEKKHWHKVTAKELQADTQYKYSVSSDGVTWSYKYNYKTPKTNAFRFASVGDPQLTAGKQDMASAYFSADQTTLAGWKETVSKISSKHVDFIAGVGDQVNRSFGGDEAEYANFFAPPPLRNIPYAPAVGNHDRHLPFIYHYNLPNEQRFDANNPLDVMGNYWYLYNNTLFVVLNTSAYPNNTADAMPYVERFDKTLRAATHANQGKYRWLIVQHHKSTASVAQHLSDTDISYYVEAGFEKLMDKHGVDLVLAGHDHVYARSHVMKDGNRVEDAYNSDDKSFSGGMGTLYLTLTTGSGLKYYEAFKPLSPSILFYAQNFKPGYALFEVNDNTMDIAVYDVDSDTAIDSFRVSKQ